MNDSKSIQPNKNANHKVDELYRTWLGRWCEDRTFIDHAAIVASMRQIRELLDEA